MGEIDGAAYPGEASGLPASTLILCTRDRPQLLLETVESVLQGCELPNELVIVDQSQEAHPQLAEMESLRGCTIRYIHSATRGASCARNIGMAAASNEVLVLIDDDFLAPPDWFGQLVRAYIQAGPRSAVTGRVLPGPSEQPGGFVPALVESQVPAVYSGRIGTDVLPSCHMIVGRDAVREIGGFDERLGPGTRFPAAEDNDYGFRLLEAGYTIVFAPEAVLYHRAWRGQGDYYPLRWAYGRSKGGFYAKYLSLRDPYMLKRMVRDVGLRFIRFPWRVLHKPHLAIGDLYYAFGILSGSVEWLWTYRLHL